MPAEWTRLRVHPKEASEAYARPCVLFSIMTGLSMRLMLDSFSKFFVFAVALY
jgi:hypothetical protein